ncbi:MAG: glycoside hydrolase family 2 protein [Solobacterium sp.]|nr:glycoside hydrolase family 2 protein [Solobacterium sp.]
MMIRLNNGWEFTSAWSDEFLHGGAAETTVRIPHTVRELPLHYVDPEDYQMVCGYRKNVYVDKEMEGKRLFLQFDAAAHIAEVFVNGTRLCEHRSGYTAFRTEFTEAAVYGAENTVVVKLDTTENGAVPPFGFAIDYLTYGGIYRDVWLDVRNRLMIEDVYAAADTLRSADVQVKLNGEVHDETLMISFIDKEGNTAFEETYPAESRKFHLDVPHPEVWSPEKPYLYTCRVSLNRDGEIIDEWFHSFGFRTVSLTENEILINGEPVFLRGLNRHQSMPYVGYAVPESLQREDARILQEELGVNAVRTSHYPQSHYFIDECDKRGLLVFTEIPGWQHVGNTEWQKQAVRNTEEMVKEYRNHPSIILWGVRINESQDFDDLYFRTNGIAHSLDPYRPTSGVRYLEKSSLLEDVYAFNDFSHDGTTPGAKPKKAVTPDVKKPMLISEANGHMFPTKSFDPWMKRQEHALRHARVLDAAMADGQHAGCFQWCMFDYPTHQDFGSGDRICYHGVLDAFRNPKTAAALYASQSDDTPVITVGSPMDIGDYPGGNIGDVYVFTNADKVVLYKNDDYVAEFTPKQWKALPHGPILIDDTIGDLLQSKEGYDEKKAAIISECLNAAGKYGMSNLPVKYQAKLAWCMMHYGMKFSDGYDLYGKYVGNWGGKSVKWRFDALKDGVVTASVTKSPSSRLHLTAVPSHTLLKENDTYDMAAIRIRIEDEYGNTASYAQIPVTIEVKGPVELVGPSAVTAEGGMTGTYIRTKGQYGTASVTFRTEQTEPVTVSFEIREDI